MAMFMAHMTHSSEACYIFNDKRREELRGIMSNRDEVAEKHEIKIISAVYPPLEHEIFYVMEAPSHKAVERYLKEIGFASYNKIKIRNVESMEKALDRL
ncbi:MAG: hypothetical protein ACXVHW_04005 [Methanobacterium sp.]